MGVTSGPKISNRGLIFAIDENNSRSWKGRPINNLIGPSYANVYHPSNRPASGAPHSNSYTLTTEIDPPVPGLEVYKSTDLVLDTQTIRFSVRLDMRSSWFQYDVPYTWSFYQYIPKQFARRLLNTTQIGLYQNSTGIDWHGQRGYDSLYNYYGAGSILNSFTSYDVTKTGQWQRVSVTFTPTTANIQLPENNGNDNNFWVAGFHRTNIRDGTTNDAVKIPYYFYISGGQVVQGADAPFTIDSRSQTQSVVDLSGTGATISEASLTYNDNNTFEFDGVDDRIYVENPDYPTTWNDPFTLETWVRIPAGATWHNVSAPTSANSGTSIIGRGSYQGSIGLLRYDSGTVKSLRFHMRSDNTLTTAIFNNAQYDTWYHMVGTYDGTLLKLYINGSLIDTQTMVKGTDQPDLGRWIIGGNIAFGGNTGLYGKGRMPFTRIYNVALTEGEVKNNFEATRISFSV